jgi:hypothetical protein
MSMHNLKGPRSWAAWSAILLATHFVVGPVLIMLLNGTRVNHIITPVVQYFGMFQLLWPEHHLNSLHFLATKSLFAFTHLDPRSGLKLWTLEYDTYTLLMYLAVSVILGWAISRYRQQAINVPLAVMALVVTGGIFVSLAVSYMTVIEHCSGANWVGFVSLYGLGFDEFELYYAYQIICAALGVVMLATGLWLIKAKKPTPA